MRFHFLVSSEGDQNAIDQATRCLAEAVERSGHVVRLAPWRPAALVRDSRDADVLVLPYNPFMWGRWGFAPRLVGDVARVRRARPRARIVLIVHEPYVPIRDAKSLVMGLWQRVQLASLLLLSDGRFASIEPWAAKFSRLRPVGHLPSGSNLPDARTDRAAARSELGVQDGIVVATLSTGHPSHLTAYVEAALARLAGDGVDVTYLRLGDGSSPVIAPAGLRVVAPGRLPAERLAALVAAADILLTPFVDGVSTRRGSLMAGLCEAVAVVGTKGALTDPMLLERGLELVEVGSAASFAERVAIVADDAERRARAAAAGRELFDAAFTWDAIAARLLAQATGE